MAKMSISSHMCGYTHTIREKIERDKIIVEIESPCEKFSGVSHLELPFMEISDTQDRRILETTGNRELDCAQVCPIPHAVPDIYRIENELKTDLLLQCQN